MLQMVEKFLQKWYNKNDASDVLEEDDLENGDDFDNKDKEKPTLQPMHPVTAPYTRKISDKLFLVSFAWFHAWAPPNENVIMSPVALYVPLMVLGYGAKGGASHEILTHLRLYSIPQKGYMDYLVRLYQTYLAYHWKMNYGQPIFLSCHALVKIPAKDEIDECYKENVSDRLKKALVLCFNSTFVGSEAEANSYFADSTNETCHKVIPNGYFDKDPKITIVGVSYFKCRWRLPFNTTLTHNKPFYVTAFEKVIVPTMHLRQMCIKYNENIDFQMIGLNLEENDFVLYFLLPLVRNKLAYVEKKYNLNESRLETLLNHIYHCRESDVTVELPRFKIVANSEVGQKFVAFNFSQMFDQQAANFSNIADLNDNDRLYVDSIFHSAVLEVTETGYYIDQDAYLSKKPTYFNTANTHICLKMNTFIANHPFLFILMDKTNRMIYQIGRVYDPSKLKC